MHISQLDIECAKSNSWERLENEALSIDTIIASEMVNKECMGRYDAISDGEMVVTACV